tara:strand:- start:954 stop:2141 length:1188 start_codon:yes stop_codon:yes gene_type:complete
MAKKENKVEEPKVEETKVKKPKNETKDNVTKVKIEKPKETITKVDLSKPPVKDEEVKEKPVEEEVVVVNAEPEVKEVVEEKQQEEAPIIQEVTNEEVTKVEQEVQEAVVEAQQTGRPLPEKVEKLISFMEETGGDLKDYVELNRDVSKMDDSDVLDEYYRKTKSHLTPEERGFLLQDSFGYDEEEDDPKDIKKKKIALKEQVAEARAHLDRQKSKYYEEIKAGSRLTEDQQKAINFFNRYNKETEQQNKLNEATKQAFLKKTENVFNNDFKGFDYQVGDKKFRFNVKDVDKVKQTQSDLNNFVNKFVGKDNRTLEDANGYHKSLYTAMNADTIAKHFYEQGKADAIKDQIAKDKNIDTNPRQTHGEVKAGGFKVRVLGDSSADIKNRSFKIRKKN